ncbi:MAG: hypothetical protein C4320_04780, partial [Armatimonadota bacterium]
MAAIGFPGFSSRRSGVANPGLAKFDFAFLATSLALIGIGLIALYSEGIARSGGGSFRKQLLNVVLGVIPFAIFFGVHPNVWRRSWKLIYGVNILLLLAVFAHGASRKGAERWIPIGPVQFQPSELSKLLVVITLAAFLAGNYDRIRSPITYLLALAHVGIPALLVLAQPHLAAAFVLVMAFLSICIVSGVPIRFIVLTGLVIALFGGIMMTVPAARNLFLHDYQKKRIEGLSNAGKDRRGKNYQTDRAAIAFGVGGVTGTGFRNGEQKAAGFIPEQHTDFVLTVIGEEFG